MGNLPEETEWLVGRRSELAQAARLCERSRLVTVSGVGGVGKTRLARRVAAGLQPQFADGAWWVELSPLSDGSGLVYALAEALALADQTTRPLLEVVAEYLAGREVLLVWDTCEHLVEDCRQAAATLLTVAPRLRILATSRRPLGLHLEEVLGLDPLPVPALEAHGGGRSGRGARGVSQGGDDGDGGGGSQGGDGGDGGDEPADALVLLTGRAAQAVPGFTVTDANRPELAALCRRLEGLPLALELAAARLRDMPAAELNKRLDDRYAILGNTETEDCAADPPWHQALRTAIGWSHELCTPAERLAWARLSVFAGTFDAESASRVLADERLPARQVPFLLNNLVRDSILQWVPTAAGERYRMLDTLRDYGAFWLRGLGEEGTLRRRHRDHYLARAQAADAAWIGPEQLTWYERTVADHPNLRAALDHCLTERDGHSALELAGALWFLWYACGFPHEGRHYLDRALALDTAPGPARAKALWTCGHTAINLGDTETSLRLAGVFRAGVAMEADESAVFAAAYLEGAALAVHGRPAQAAQALDAVPGTRPNTGRYDAAWFLLQATRAFVHVLTGQFVEALTVAEELCAECGRRGETWMRAWGDYLRALAALQLGRAAEAAAHARTALGGKRRLHDSVGMAMSLDVLACAYVACGHAEQAARILGIGEQIWHGLGTPQMGSPDLVAARAACEQQARRLLGSGSYETAFDTGYGTDLNAGITHALTPPDTPPPTSSAPPGPTG
ncbi:MULTISPECIES: LuxR family transcriptional regulator [unclassified Streptomyces]|uniref:ATP-binding protein n=1 Tax=unclassified Streptomyces TaxID=2593676 RepID=UPI00136EDB95|nr:MULTISPECIES: LuxR family transcriptional regulator [unclassified Streptomyces]MYY87051.1 LuxR family transcriptional regulator [Streptomyces sp. SID335]MYZ13191.1 LuxR family transcriptional regulator [Streptomyces sp. SID337]NDZ89528.1 LuxR family transcriptional regulator [Streptomyces sp. SID10115]NEB49681.1 LuxR family transcriptional regulator [Streptomyces sp. SID339]